MSDLTTATRTFIVKTLKHEVFWRMPVYEALERRGKVTFRGGTAIERPVTMDTMESLAQAYGTNTPLTDEAKDMLAKPKFTWKKLQLPLRYTCDWEIQNANASDSEQIVDLVQFLGNQAQDGIRRKMTDLMFNSASTTGVGDNTDDFQSLVSALDHDTTYGTFARNLSANTRDWWQGADAAGLTKDISTSAQATAATLSISNLRKWIYETDVAHYMKDKSDLQVAMCPTLFNKVRAEMESKMIYKPSGDKQRQGFNKMLLDGSIEIVEVPYLQRSSTTKTWLFILNLNEWELRISTARNFKLTPFEWQGKNTNGFDYYLARILVAGNLCCWKPNGNLWLSNVS